MNLDLGNGVELVQLNTTSNSSNSITLSGTGNSGTIPINTSTLQYISYPHYSLYYPWYTINYNTEPVFDIKTRKVENGFIVLKGTKEYVFSDEKELAKFIKDSYKTKKEK